MAGRKTPTKILELRGAFKKNPQRKRDTEPQPEREVGNPPDFFDNKHKAAWEEIKNQSPPRVLLCSDRFALEVLCCLLVEYRNDHVSFPSTKLKCLESLLSRCGFTPSDRSRVGVGKQSPKNDFDDF